MRNEEIEEMVIRQLMESCCVDEKMQSIVERLQSLYRKQQAQSQRDVGPLRKEKADLQRNIENWIEAWAVVSRDS